MKILGLMSGTSGDGIDGVVADFDDNERISVLWHKTYNYADDVFFRIKNLIKNANAQDITLGHSYIAEQYVLACKSFFENETELPEYIAAHGQTVWHEPNEQMWNSVPVKGTLQLLDPAILSFKTGLPVIYDFRRADMAVGGQGAPLVPFADKKIFQDYCCLNKYFIVLNVGGMANITVLKRINEGICVESAFDTGPGNVLLDEYMQRNKLGKYDKNGIIAKSGKTDVNILQHFLGDRYFSLKPPKSTGREYFNLDRFGSCVDGMSYEDALSTLLDFTVYSIFKACESFLSKTEYMCVAGGGAFNNELMGRLSKLCSKYGVKCVTSSHFGIPVMAREALAFAVLGYAYLKREPSNVISATGAKKEVTLGCYCKV